MQGVLHGGRGPRAGWVATKNPRGPWFRATAAMHVRTPISCHRGPHPTPKGNMSHGRDVASSPEQTKGSLFSSAPPKVHPCGRDPFTKWPSVLLETATSHRPEKHVLCADGQMSSSSCQVEKPFTWQQDCPGSWLGKGCPTWTISGRSRDAQVHRVTGWHPGPFAVTGWHREPMANCLT